MSASTPDYWQQRRQEVLPYIPRNSTSALDIGCAGGAFGRELQAIAPHILIDGIESDEAAAGEARIWYRHVYRGTFPQITPNRRYSVVICNDVLEHMIDPWGAVRTIRAILEPRGVVVASIPNMRHWSALQPLLRGRWDYTDYGVLDRTHLRWFTKATMRELFETSGFDVQVHKPLTGSTPSSPIWRIARVLAPSTVADLLTKQYVIVASPTEA